jgi:hypothetical protein
MSGMTPTNKIWAWIGFGMQLGIVFSLGCSRSEGAGEDGENDGIGDGSGTADSSSTKEGSDDTGERDPDSENRFWESDDFDECAAVAETAENEYQPLDIIFIIDNTPSMLDEINEVRANMNLFSERIVESGLDARIVLVSCLPGDCGNKNFHGICIDAPLGAEEGCIEGGPYDDTNLPDYLHVSEKVASVKGLEITLNTFDEWRSMLRPGAKTHFVIVSDDTDETSAEAFDEAVRQLDPDQFKDYQFNGIFAYMSKDDACAIGSSEPCCTYAAPEGNTDSWDTVYADLVTLTGGVSGDLCLQDFDPVFDELVQSVIASAELSCEWEIPKPPDGETLDPSRVNIDFLDGEGAKTLIGNVESEEQCDRVDNAWYYDNPEDPEKIMVCPATCDWIRRFPHAQIVLQFGCETEVLVV